MKVTIYSTPMCTPCEQLKSYLRRCGIEFAVRDLLIDEEAADHLESLGMRGSPVLEVDGNVYAGSQLDRENLDIVLGLKPR